MDWLLNTLRENAALAIFLTLGLGFWLGKFKYKGFSLGTVTSVLLVGVLVGQLDIPVGGPLKEVSFLLFLFAIGYSVGPQFFRALSGSGLKQVLFAVVMCVICFAVTWGVCLLFGYNVGEALGLFAGAQTVSAVIGVGGDAIRSMSASDADKLAWTNIIPVCYAVTYIFGTIGSAWILSWLGPKMLGGIKKVKADTAALAASMDGGETPLEPEDINALRGVAYRAYRAEGSFFDTDRTVKEVQDELERLGRRAFVERIRKDGTIISDITPSTIITKDSEVVLSARREFLVEDESWIGPEVADLELLSFPVEKVPVLLARKESDGMTVEQLRKAPWMAGVIIGAITSGGHSLPVLAQTQVHRGDTLELQGSHADISVAASHLGYIDRPTNATDMVFVGLGIFIGALIGAITLHLGGIPISLSTSGGALIAGLVLGWLRSKHPTFGKIPAASLWVLNNVGLNLFIAVIGISSGPSFISGIKEVGWLLLVAGVLSTSIPLIIGIWLGDKVFKFPAAINLGCVAGSRVTTAALGAVQDALGSTMPAMGYTITYAVGNTLLILMGVLMTLLL